jgi:hypothetical protein
VSTPAPEARPPAAEGSIRCARCGAEVARDQDWCLECGLAARTRVAPTPRWRVPLVGAAVVAALALAALAVAFVDLTEDPAPAPAATTAAPATQPPPAATPAPQTQPPAATATAPGATATPPAQTTTNPTATAPAAPDVGGEQAP